MAEPTSALCNESSHSRERDNSAAIDNAEYHETRRLSFDLEEGKLERRVLVLYTGGTIGMVRDEDEGAYVRRMT